MVTRGSRLLAAAWLAGMLAIVGAPGALAQIQPGPGAGGSGGAVTVGNGADTAEGATSDVAVAGDVSGSVEAHLRYFSKVYADVWDATNHAYLVNLATALSSTVDSIAAVGPTASGSAVTANPTTSGGRAMTALPTAVSDGQVVNIALDKFGRVITRPLGPRGIIATQTTTITASTAETTVGTAVAGTFLDLAGVIVANTSVTATQIDFRDTTAGSVIFSVYAPAGATTGFMPPVPIPQSAVNHNWTATCGTSVTSAIVFLQMVKDQ